jgi:hypothetical protein
VNVPSKAALRLAEAIYSALLNRGEHGLDNEENSPDNHLPWSQVVARAIDDAGLAELYRSREYSIEWNEARATDALNYAIAKLEGETE